MMRWRDQSGPTRPRRSEPSGSPPPSARPPHAKRPTIGVLVDSLRSSYQTTVLGGLADAADRRDVNLVVFAGGVLGAPGSGGVNRNFVFTLCDKQSVDGVVVLGGALGNHLGPSAVADICARL